MNTIVKTKYGKVRGIVANGVFTFKGIPYAAPPFGNNRFLPPRPVEPWNSVRDALNFGSEAPQLRPDPQTAELAPDPAVPGMDCLNLNIWSPDLGAVGLPVMVWIHGGMFEVGSGATYNGSRFARDGIVCVTINYRVGVDGFLYLGKGKANLGLLDQVAALEWVRDNIAAFGGDPGNVTIFGESAGAMSVGTLLSMPLADGLFRRAIAQSMAAHQVISVDTAQQIGKLLAQKLGVEASREAIAAVPLDRLLAAQEDLKADLLSHPDPKCWSDEVLASMMLWQPVVDGDTIPLRPIDRIINGAGANVDIMVGTNTDEWRLFLVANGEINNVTDETLARTVAAYGLPMERTLAIYTASHPGASAGDLLAAIQTDWWCRIPVIRLAEAYAKRNSATYMYEFAWPSPQFNGLLGACHALEIPFVFDTLNKEFKPMLGPLLGDNPPQQLADTMHVAWVAFATNGDCGWPKYDLDRRATMRFDTTSMVVDNPRAVEREIWKGVR
jgi:para-nitrobenzyl esterase